MDNLILAEQGSTFSMFGVGFLAGFAFSVVVFLAIDIISQSKNRRKRADRFVRRAS